MVLGNEHITRPERAHLPNRDESSADDRVVAVRSLSTSVGPRRLRAEHRAVLRALVAHLMPVDDGAAVQTDMVVRYIDWLVANECAVPDAPLTLAEVYRSGCELIQAHACRAYGRHVQDMAATERDQLVWDMLECSMDGFDRFSPAYFFHTIRRHIADAMQGGTITPN